MSIENPYSGGIPEHSDFNMAAEHLRPPADSTVQSLFDLITDRTAGGVIGETRVIKTYRYMEDKLGSISAVKFFDTESADDVEAFLSGEETVTSGEPQRIALIKRVERDKDVEGDLWLYTNYFVIQDTEGLSLEKFSHIYDPDNLEDIHDPVKNGTATWDKIRQSQAMERESGLSFVSDHEAKEVYGLLYRADPIHPTNLA